MLTARNFGNLATVSRDTRFRPVGFASPPFGGFAFIGFSRRAGWNSLSHSLCHWGTGSGAVKVAGFDGGMGARGRGHGVRRHQPARPGKGVVRFCNGRGMREQWTEEGKNALSWMRLSCHEFARGTPPRSWLVTLTAATHLWYNRLSRSIGESYA